MINVLQIGRQDRRAAAALIYQCFGGEYFSLGRDNATAVRCIEGTLTDRFFGAYIGGELAAVLGYSDSEGRACRFDLGAARRELGLLRALRFGLDMHSDTSLGRFAEVRRGEAALLEYICTAPHLRGRGAATALIEHALSCLPQEKKLIEVYEGNPAERLYRGLGFEQVGRQRLLIAQKNFKYRLRLVWQGNK